ncbi:hypothetical protein A2U01_0018977 [Trifolium medium]|uniref:Uncharacterized protein n=1 Tax=Trifolium medium TaxID=97028 RepID=A0A392NFL1_9FABA|nr:hypothetical protein [Trifolium medium]
MSENLLQGIESIGNNGSSYALSGRGEKILTDKLILMIVKKFVRADELSDHVVEVLRITDDIDVIKKCGVGNIGMVSSMEESVGRGKNALIEDCFPMVSRKKYNEFKVPRDNILRFGDTSSEASSSAMRF